MRLHLIVVCLGFGSACSSSASSAPATVDDASADDTGVSPDDSGAADTLSTDDTRTSDGPASSDTAVDKDTGVADTGGSDTGGTTDTGPTDAGPADTGPTACTLATCPSLAGSYAGPYSMYTAEKLGASVVNEMQCTGTNAIVIDPSKPQALNGTVKCTYSGSLGGFDKNQTGTLTGSVFPDGSVSGELVHHFGPTYSITLSFKGKLASGTLTVMGTGSWKPNPLSAVPWTVSYSFSSTKI